MDDVATQPQQPTQDQGWNAFVEKGTAKPQEDPKWSDFVQSRSNQANTPPPTTQEAVTSLIKPGLEAFAGHVMDAIKPAPAAQPDPTISADLSKFRNSKGYQENEQAFLQLANDAVLKPAVQSFVNTWKNIGTQISEASEPLHQQQGPVDEYGQPRAEEPVEALGRFMGVTGQPFAVAGAAIGGPAQTASKPVFEHFGATPEEAEAMSKSFGPNVGQLPFFLEGALHKPGNPINTMARAKAAGVLDGDDAFFGTRELPPEQQASIEQAQAAIQPTAGAPSTPVDVETVARNLAPETFIQRDRLTARADDLRNQLSSMSSERTKDIDDQIATIKDAKEGGYGKLQALTKKREEIVAQDTPVMAEIRQKLQSTDYQMRDLASEVSTAMRAADAYMPKEEATPEAQPEPKQEESPAGASAADQRSYIINDITQKLSAVGRPKEEVDAAAQLEVARYETLAQQYPKFSAKEWYDRESANIKAGKERARILAQADYSTPAGDIPKAKNLSDQYRSIEAGLVDKVGNHFDDAAKEYAGLPETGEGKILNTDSARELSEDYKSDRTKSAAVHEPASWFVKKLYAEKLKEAPKEGEDNLVTFTAGGTGAGKSSATKGMEETLNKSQIIYDTNMNKYESSVQKVEQALKAGKDVEILYVYRDPLDALVNGALPRAERMAKKLGSGRTVPLSEHAETHMGSREVIEKIAQKYAGDERVKITVIDNSKGQGKSTAIPLEKLPKTDYSSLHERLQTALDQERSAGRISDKTYQGFLSGREKPEDRGRGGQELELQRDTQRPDELEQASRGKIRLATDDAKATITLMKNANASTLIHEKGHEWTDQILRLADNEDAPEQMKNDAKALRKYGGAKEDGTIPVKGHEKIARGFERFFMEGTAPNKELAGIFALYKKLLTAIYKTVDALRSPISDDIRDVFTRFLSTNPEKTILARDHEPGEMMANIHEADAANTPPEKAAEVRDNIRAEVDRTAQAHDKEIGDGLKSAEQATGVPEEAPVHPESVSATQQPTGTPEPSEKPTEVNAGRSGLGTESHATRAVPAREEPTESSREPTSPTEILGKSKPYFISDKGVINFDLFKTPEDIQRYLQEWSERNPDKISQARGGVVTLEQTTKLAQSMGMTTEDLLSRKVGQLYDGPQQVAAAQLFIQSSKRIKDAADAARASGDPQAIIKFFTDLEDHKDFMDMFLQQVGISAEASRALGARRAIKKLGGFEEAMQIGDLFQKMTGMNLKDAKVQADLFASLDSPEKISKMAQKSREANFEDYIIAYRNNNLLSGPVTHMHYADGSILNVLYKPLKVAVASSLPGGPRLGEAGAMASSMVLGAQKGWMAAKAAWTDGIDRSFQDTIENYKSPTQVRFNPTFDKLLGRGGFVGKSISSIHSFVYTMNYEQEVAGQSFRQALKEGLEEKTDAFNNRVSDLTVNPTPEIMAYADKASKKAVYMENPEWGTTMSAFTQFANRTSVGKFLFPFAKMEMNVKKEGLLNNTVLGLFSKDVRANLAGANGSEARAIQIAGMTMGTSIAGLVWAAGDNINGNGPSNPGERKVWLLTHTPNSVQIGNVAIPMRAMGNIGQILMAGAEIREAFSEMSEGEHDSAAAIFMEHVSRAAFEGTFVQNVSEVANAYSNPKQYGEQFIKNTALGFVPYTTLLGQANRYIDPFQREVRSQGMANLFGITDAAKAKIPFLSQSLQPKVDVLGNPIPTDKWLAASAYDRYASDPIVMKLNSINAGIPAVRKDIMGVKLTDDQYHDYAIMSGALLKQNIGPVLESPYFDEMSATAKIKEVSKIVETSRKIAGQALMFQNQDLMQKVIEKKQSKY